MNTDGVTIPSAPDPSKANPKDLLQQIGQLNQQLIRERQEATRKYTESQTRCKAEMDRLRQTTYQHGKDLENQVSVLLQSLGRMKEENDELKRQILTLQLQGSNGIARAQAQPVDGAAPPATVAISPQAPSLGGEEIPLPPRS